MLITLAILKTISCNIENNAVMSCIMLFQTVALENRKLNYLSNKIVRKNTSFRTRKKRKIVFIAEKEKKNIRKTEVQMQAKEKYSRVYEFLCRQRLLFCLLPVSATTRFAFPFLMHWKEKLLTFCHYSLWIFKQLFEK